MSLESRVVARHLEAMSNRDPKREFEALKKLVQEKGKSDDIVKAYKALLKAVNIHDVSISLPKQPRRILEWLDDPKGLVRELSLSYDAWKDDH